MVISEIIQTLKQKNKTLLISSHIFSTLNENCDYIMLLKNGKIAKKVAKAQFSELEQAMKSFIVQHKIDRLKIF
jgi:ABC-2 type transport system ATP-binding protein